MSQYQSLNVLPPGQYKILLEDGVETQPAYSVVRCTVGKSFIMQGISSDCVVETIEELKVGMYRVTCRDGDGTEEEAVLTEVLSWCRDLAKKVIEIADASARRQRRA